MNRILFVCLGNICRSPLAEGLFLKHLHDRGLEQDFIVDSAGTSDAHTGQPADSRTRKNALENGVQLTHRARQFRKQDFVDYDLILVMDNSNMRNVKALEPALLVEDIAEVRLMRDFDVLAPGTEVPDPYYGGERGFQEVFDMLHRSTAHLLDHLTQKRNQIPR